MKLEKLMKRLLPVVMATGMYGCASRIALDYPLKSTDDVVKVHAGVRGALDYAHFAPEISKEARTVPVHPDDAPYTGSVSPDLDDINTISPRLGVEAGVGLYCLTLRGGIDERLNLVSEQENREWQNLPPPYKSGGLVKLDVGTLTTKPFVAVDITPFGKVRFSFEYGWPITDMKFSAGHDRFNKFSPILEDSVKGTGKSYGASATVKLFDDEKGKFFVGVKYDREEYDFEKVGNIKTDITSVFIERRF